MLKTKGEAYSGGLVRAVARQHARHAAVARVVSVLAAAVARRRDRGVLFQARNESKYGYSRPLNPDRRHSSGGRARSPLFDRMSTTQPS